MPKVKLIHIGTFGEPVGLKGEISIVSFTSNLKFFLKIGALVNESNENKWNLNFIRKTKMRTIVKINNINSRESVKFLKGKKIFVDRGYFSKTKKNEFFIIDLINCKVISKDKKIFGIVKSIENFGAGDLINVKSIKGRDFFIPMNKQNVVAIDLENKKLIINPMKGMVN